MHYSLKSLLNCTCISYMAMLLQLSPTQPAFFFLLFFWLHGCCCFLPSCSNKNFLINSYIWLGCQDFFFFFFFAIFNFFYISIITTFLVYPGLLQQPRGLFTFHLSFTLPIHSQLPQLEQNGAMRGTLGFKKGEWKICHQNSDIWFRVQLNKYDWCTHPSTI